ncbi:MAG: urease accessory protein UreH domain-containing protein, partial [Kofleriaceae bacterium]
MIEVVPAVFVSSLLGSVHCLAMCGPLVAVHGGSREPRTLLLHGLGRLTSYAALGVLAGVVGRAVDLAGRVGDVQRTAALLAAIAILGASAHAIAVAAGWRGFGLRS